MANIDSKHNTNIYNINTESPRMKTICTWKKLTSIKCFNLNNEGSLLWNYSRTWRLRVFSLTYTNKRLIITEDGTRLSWMKNDMVSNIATMANNLLTCSQNYTWWNITGRRRGRLKKKHYIHICFQRWNSAVAMVIASTSTGDVAHYDFNMLHFGDALMSVTGQDGDSVAKTSTHNHIKRKRMKLFAVVAHWVFLGVIVVLSVALASYTVLAKIDS